MKKTFYILTKRELAFFNKLFKGYSQKMKNYTNELISNYENNTICQNLNERDFLKRLGIKTRALKKDASNYKELIENHYNGKVETVKNNILSLINNDEIATFKNCEVITEWRKSSVWGWNPNARVWVNNRFAGEDSASGCGYDKQSAAINGAIQHNDIFKKSVIIRAIKTLAKGEALPYGITANEFGIYASFGGCGVSTFTSILKWLGAENVKVSGRDSESIFTY